MKYVVLVSHGTLAPGMANAVGMLAGSDRDDILAVGMEEDMGADIFADKLREKLKVVKPEDEILLFADIVGGSPLTTAANVIAEEGLLDNTAMVGGMNLPFVITSTLMKDIEDTDELIDKQIQEASQELKRFSLEVENDDDDI